MRNRTSDLSETETLYGGQSLLRSYYMTRVLYTARISNVDSVVFCIKIKKDGKF